jgi:predicted  nucleic acid-binding Zn-ribbon protein
VTSPEITPATIAFETDAAKAASTNARGMVLSREERIKALEDRVSALTTRIDAVNINLKTALSGIDDLQRKVEIVEQTSAAAIATRTVK